MAPSCGGAFEKFDLFLIGKSDKSFLILLFSSFIFFSLKNKIIFEKGKVTRPVALFPSLDFVLRMGHLSNFNSHEREIFKEKEDCRF